MPPLDRHILPTLALVAGLALGAQARDVATDSVNTFAPAAEAPKPAQVLREVAVTATKPKPSARRNLADSGYRVDSATSLGPLKGLDLQKTPYAVNVVSQDEIENREAHLSVDVFKNNPSLSSNLSSSAYCSMSNLQARGFTAGDQNTSRDGLGDRAWTVEPVENVERAEALTGVSGLFYGFSSLGGVINYVTKKPTAQPYRAFSSGVYGGGIFYQHADIGGPVDSAGKVGYRAGAYHEEGNTTVSGGREQRNLFYGSATWKLSPNTTLGANGYYQHYFAQGLNNYILPTPSAGIGVPDPKRFDPSVQYGQKWTYNETDKTVVSANLQTKWNDVFSFRGAGQYGDMYREYNLIDITLTDNDGNYKETYSGSPRQYEYTKSAYALVDAHFLTGPFKHEATFGYNGTYFEFYRGPYSTAVLGTSNISSPSYYAIPSYPTKNNVRRTTYYDNAPFVDRISLGDELVAIVGASYAQIRSKNYALPNDSVQQYTLGTAQTAWSPSLALSYTPIKPLTVYGNYMQGLSQGGTAASTFANPNLSNATCPVKNALAILPASASHQLEGGVKGRLWGVNLSVDYFYLDKVNEYVDPSDSTYKQDGRQESKGVEFYAQGKLLRDLSVAGGFTWMSAEYTKVQLYPTWVGSTPIDVPEKQARLFLEYSLPWFPLHVSGGANYYGRRPIDVPNTAWIGDVTTLDAGIRFDPVVAGYQVSLQANVSNLLDKRYWANYVSEGLEMGSPRVVSASGRITF
jgi:iron complex outermembrane receptor protein